MMILLAILIFLSATNTTAYENLALRKPAYQDDEWTDERFFQWGAQNAVDGLFFDRSASGDECTISKNHKWRATWRVDLLSIVSISHINIYFRTDNRPSPGLRMDRLGGFFLYVSNTTSKDDGHLCFHDVESGYESRSEDKRINCSVQGRYVIYYNERRPGVTYPSYYSKYAHNDLCEVQVWGCPSPSQYGENCTKPCPDNCQEHRCDIITGECLGCAPGYRGPRCSQTCDDQRYGPGCALSCGHCRNGETCHHVNGTCLKGCKEGMAGEKCQKECPTGSFGLHCQRSCKEYCGGEGTCNPVTGICHSGCKKGWTGPLCSQVATSWTHALTIIIPVASVIVLLIGTITIYLLWKRKQHNDLISWISNVSGNNTPRRETRCHELPMSKIQNREQPDSEDQIMYQYRELDTVSVASTEELRQYF